MEADLQNLMHFGLINLVWKVATSGRTVNIFCDENLWSIPLKLMRVPIQPIRTTGRWGYLTGNRREATPYFMAILVNIRGNETFM